MSVKNGEVRVRSRSEFSYKVEAHTPLALVFAYLNGKLSKAFTLREGKQRAADALMAFWKPYAFKASKSSSDDARDAARSSVEVLCRQIRRICEDFGIESPFDKDESVDFSDLLAALTARVEPSALSPLYIPFHFKQTFTHF